MKKASVKRLNRAERAQRLLRRQWCSSMDIVRAVGTVTPSKVISEVREMVGASLISRRRDGVNQYRVRV